MAQLQLTVGAGVDRPQGRRLLVETNGDPVGALCLVLEQRWARDVEAWIASAVFEGDYRLMAKWEGQQLLWVDNDYHDPATKSTKHPKGKHSPLPDNVRAAIQYAIDMWELPGSVVYLTPRGFRVGFLLATIELDILRAKRAARGAIELVRQVVATLPDGLEVDDGPSSDVARLMFTPNSYVKGEQREAVLQRLDGTVWTADMLIEHAPARREVAAAKRSAGKRSMPGYLGELVAHLDADDYDGWIRTGMGLKFTFGDTAFDVWNAWSTTSNSYPGAEDARWKWDSFQREDGAVLSFDTVKEAARSKGWNPGVVFGVAPPPPPGDGALMTLRMSDVQPREIDWLWENRFPIGKLSLLSGAPGAAKSYFTHYMASVISRGAEWCDGSPCEQGEVLLISCEDDPYDALRPRLDACGAAVEHIHVATGVKRIDPKNKKTSQTVFTIADLKPLRLTLTANDKIRLVVIDPIGSYFGGGKDSYIDTEVRALLEPLAEMARRFKVAMLIVAHTRKSSGGGADDSVMGSRAFTGLARIVHHLFRDPANRARRLLLPGKSNVASEDGGGLAFRLVGHPTPRLDFELAPVRMSADQMAHKIAKGGHASGQEREVKGATATWLREVLINGPVAAGEVQQMAKAAGLNWSTVQKAMRDLGVLTKRHGFGGGSFVWTLPIDTELEEMLS